MYDGEIYKTRNLKNKSMVQMYSDPDDLKRAQDSIQNRLDNFEKKLWVPSREEVIAAREAREALEAAGDTTAVSEEAATERTTKSRATKRSTKRSTKDTKAKAAKEKKPKVAKSKAPKSSSSNAARSVRRRK